MRSPSQFRLQRLGDVEKRRVPEADGRGLFVPEADGLDFT